MPAETIPRYLEIAEYLRRLVAARRPGDRLPSDAELCQRFGVSRMTARQAVQVLATEQLLTRRRGDGTFVAGRTALRTLGSPLSFTESMRRRGLRATSRVLVAEWTTPDEDEVQALALGAREQILRLERLRLADGRPMAIERAALAPSVGAVVSDDLEQGSLHAAFERLGRSPMQAQARVSARRATSAERRMLQLGPGGVVLVERRIISDQDDRPLEHTETVYAAERYEFEAVLRPDARADRA
jgi:GntR family transcriptional regulator